MKSSPAMAPAPRLDPQLRQTCPDLPRVTDGSAIGIASADADSSIEYRKCQARHEGTVAAFDALARAYELLRSAIVDGVKGGKNVK